MCFSAEVSLVTSGVLVLLGVAMMIRRLPLDVILAGFVLALGVIQIIEFGIHAGVLPSSQAGRLLYVTLLTQCAVLAIGVWAVFGGVVAGGLSLLTVAVLGVGLILSTRQASDPQGLMMGSTFSAKPGPSGHIEWSKDGGSLLGGVMGVLYLFGLFAPLVLVTLFAPSVSGVAVGSTLLGYGLFSALFVYLKYPPAAFSSLWCLFSVFFGILAWFMATAY